MSIVSRPAVEDVPRVPRYRYWSSAFRIGALVSRYLRVLAGSWPRLIELFYGPTLQVIIWGFVTEFLRTHSSWVAQASGVFISAALLWDVLNRAQGGLCTSFLEEVWYRNLGHLFISPVRPFELVLAWLSTSVIRTLIGLTPAVIVASAIWGYSIETLGLPLAAFFINLMAMGWAIGLAVIALVFRYGRNVEAFSFFAVAGFAPLSGVFYPTSTLPAWLRPVAWGLPSTHVFEGMRAQLLEGVFRLDHFLFALGLNILYLTAAAVCFVLAWRHARRQGRLLHVGF